MKRITVPLVLPLVLLLVACGSGGGGDGVSTLGGGKGASPTASASVDPQDAFRRFAQCMRENGVDVPDPDSGDGGLVVVAPSGAPHAMGEAERKCQPLLKDVIREGPKMNDPEMQDRALKFARCMREHGVDMPDPNADGSILQKAPAGGAGSDPKFDPRSPKFQEAQKACGGLLGNVEVAGP